MKVGDLVRPIRRLRRRTMRKEGNSTDERSIGVVVEVGIGRMKNQVKIKWNNPTWYDPTDGLSPEYMSELEVISESR